MSENRFTDRSLLADIATARAHRACGSEEHDSQNGKLHGYCVVCLVPWPCETANFFTRKNDQQSIINKLREISDRERWTDTADFNALEFSGGNYDDAYSAGKDDGKTTLAKELLKEFFNG